MTDEEYQQVTEMAGIKLPREFARALWESMQAKKAGTAQPAPVKVASFPEISPEEFRALKQEKREAQMALVARINPTKFYGPDLAVLRALADENPFPDTRPFLRRDLDGDPYAPFRQIATGLAVRLKLDEETVCSALHFWYAQYFLTDSGQLDDEIISHYLQTGKLGHVGVFSLMDQMRWAGSLPEGICVSAAIRAEILGKPLPGVPRHPKPLVIRPINDISEPVFMVHNMGEHAHLRQVLKLDKRVAAGEISKWYANRAISVVTDEMCADLLEKLQANEQDEGREYNPIVLAFENDDLVRALKAAGFVATSIATLPETLDEVSKIVQIAMPLVEGGTDDLPAAALDGGLGRICRERLGDFPRAYAYLALLACASVYVPVQNRCNLFVCLVGPMGTGKSQAEEKAAWQLSVGVPPLLKLKAGSGEGLAAELEANGGKARLLYPDELGHLLEKAQIDNASFPYILNTAFYEDEQHLRVSKRKELSFKARLSLLGGIVDERFDDVFGRATTGGLYDRFLFGQCPPGVGYLYRPTEGTPAYMPPSAPRLEDETIGGAVEAAQFVPVTVDEGVYMARDRWVKEIPGLTPRIAELAIRAAIVAASFDGRSRLTVADLGPAKALAEYQVKVRTLLRPNPGESKEGRLAHKFLNYLKRHAPDGRWVSRKKMYDDTNAHDIGTTVADRVLVSQAHNGYVELGEEGPRGAKVVRLKVR